MKIFEINGNKFRGKKSFLKYTEAIFTFGVTWETGKNLDAFVDLLRGGFGRHDYNEPIVVKWINMKKSEDRLPNNLYKSLIEIFEDAENVTFIREEYNG
jgi:RNAse (barnase) inhibitor barstar